VEFDSLAYTFDIVLRGRNETLVRGGPQRMSLKKTLKETPSQTAGPYVHIGTLPAVAGIDVPVHDTSNNTGLEGGTPIIIKGVIRDGGGELVKDAMVEIWQAGADGQYGPGRKGWARSHTDFETGEFRFETVKPGKLAVAPGVGGRRRT
jgi:protocatechuate 3,4-dioxygenase alpha subunit